jgi:hypothetical protein
MMDYLIIPFLYLLFFTAMICLIPIGLLYGLDEFLYRKGIFWTGTPLTFLILLILARVLGFSNLLDPVVVTDSGYDGSIFVILAMAIICNILITLFLLKIPGWYAIKILHKRPGVYSYRIVIAALLSILITQISFFESTASGSLGQTAGFVPEVYMSSSKPQLAVGMLLMVLSAIGLFLEIRHPFTRNLILHDELIPPDPLPKPIRPTDLNDPS